MELVNHRTVGALPRALPSELSSRVPGMTQKDAGTVSLLAYILGDIMIRYDDYVINIISGRISGIYRVAPKQRSIHSS